MRSDDARTIVVAADRPNLSAAVRGRVTSEVAVVRWAAATGLEEAWRRCRPWPWVVIGAGPVPGELPELIAEQPVVVAWLAGTGALLPTGWLSLDGWGGLAAWLDRLGRSRVGSLHLAPYRGVAAGGRVVRAPAVEALLAAHPGGLAASPAVHGARGQLTRHALPGRLHRRGDLLHLEADGARQRKAPLRRGGIASPSSATPGEASSQESDERTGECR